MDMSASSTATAAEPRPRLEGMSAFAVLAGGQTVSMFGSELTAFVLGVWVYQQTGSATAFSLLAFAGAVPAILISPITGALIDRWDRRWAMILSDTGAGIGTAFLVLLAWQDRLELGWIYLLVALSATFEAFQYPAFSASISLLVPRRHLGRANGIRETASSCASLLAPLTAGVLLAAIGLQGVFLLDLATFSVALLTLTAVRIPRPPESAGGDQEGPILRQAAAGWSYLRQRDGLLALLALFAALNFTQGLVLVLLTPLVLSFATPIALGIVMSAGGLGMIAGGLYMIVTGGPRRRVRAIFACFLIQGLILFLGGVQPSVPLVATAAFCFSLGSPIIIALSQSIWQTKVAPELQGRIFAIRQMVAMSFMPLAFLLAGPLADRVFEPLLAEGGALAGSIGRLIGVGPGRGVGLLFILLGLTTLVTLAVAASYPRLRQLEDELPDALPDEQPDEPTAVE